MSTNGELWTAKQVGAVMGLSAETVRWYSTQYPERVPPRIGWGSRVLWDSDVVTAWLEARRGSAKIIAAPLAKTPPPIERPPRVVKAGRPRRVDL